MLSEVGSIGSESLRSTGSFGPGASPFCAKTTSWRLKAPPSGVRVVLAFARLLAMTSIASRSAESADALTSMEV